jgi:dTDP-4-amino-4,6-dideoxygalactose transaminase
VHRHPFFQPYLHKGDAFPRADDYYARCISLPIFPDMTDADVGDVADAVTRLAAHFART